MYEIPTTDTPARPDLPPSAVGLRWVAGYALLGWFGGGAAFLLIERLGRRPGWSWQEGAAAAWALVILFAAPFGVGLQHYLLRPYGLRFRTWIKASWITLAVLAVVAGLALAAFSSATGLSPATVFFHPRVLLQPLERLTDRALPLSDHAMALGLRGAIGLLFGLIQAWGWRSNRSFRWIWPLACACAGLLSGYGEDLGWWLAERVSESRVCGFQAAGWCPHWLGRAIEGGLYWGATWLLMGAITAGPVMYLVRCHQRGGP